MEKAVIIVAMNSEGEKMFPNKKSPESVREEESSEQKVTARILKGFSDQEIAALSKSVWVNTLADTPWRSPLTLPGEEELHTLIKKTSPRLLDLGSANTVLAHELRDSEFGIQTIFPQAGIYEYIGVDLGVDNYEEEISSDYDKGQKNLKIKLIHGEILSELHKFPADYGNVWMHGLQPNAVIRHSDDWAIALLSELKRVVPDGGFISTDFMFMGNTLYGVSKQFADFFKALRELGYSPASDRELDNEPDPTKRKILKKKKRMSGRGMKPYIRLKRMTLISPISNGQCMPLI